MKKSRFIKVMMVAVVVLSFGSCKNWIDPDYNIDPNNPVDVSLKLLLPSAQGAWAYVLGGDMGRYNSVITQHHGGVERQHAGLDVYVFTEVDVNNSWQTVYASIMYELKLMIGKAEEVGFESPYYAGIAKAMLAHILLTMTDLYDAIPYSDAFKGAEGSLNPKYDSQETLYGTVQGLLDDAIADLGAATSIFKPTSDDMIFGGSKAAWIKFANSLKARAYLHLGKKSAANYTSALNAINAGGMASNADDADFNFGTSVTENNPWYQFIDQRGDIRMGGFFVDLMVSLGDPRLDAFCDTTGSGGYKGSPAGVPTLDANYPGGFYVSKNSPVPFITYAETEFIKAEALMQSGGSAADIHTAFMNGVIAACEKVGVAPADAATYFASIDPGSGSVTMNDIMTQKYIAMYSQPESFTDWRRTGIPALSPAAGETQIPRRWPYAQAERLYNQANNPQNVSIFSKVWWDN